MGVMLMKLKQTDELNIQIEIGKSIVNKHPGGGA